MIGGGPIAPIQGRVGSAVGTGDFNGDGHSDILWQNASGQVSVWEMNGNDCDRRRAVAANPGPSWRAV